MGSSPADTVTIKVSHAGQTKRSNFPRADLTYESLCEWMTTAFALPAPLNHAPQPGCMMPRLAYRDPEGDAVTLSSNDELLEALRLKSADAPLVLQLTFPRPRERWHRLAANGLAGPAPECLLNDEPAVCQLAATEAPAASTATATGENASDSKDADSAPSKAEEMTERRRAIQAWRASVVEARTNGTPLPPHPFLGMNHPVFRRGLGHHGPNHGPHHGPHHAQPHHQMPENDDSCAANGVHGAHHGNGPFSEEFGRRFHHPHGGPHAAGLPHGGPGAHHGHGGPGAHHWGRHQGHWNAPPAFGPYPMQSFAGPMPAPFYPYWHPWAAPFAPATAEPTPAATKPASNEKPARGFDFGFGFGRRYGAGHKEWDEQRTLRMMNILLALLVLTVFMSFAPVGRFLAPFFAGAGACVAFATRRRVRKAMKLRRMQQQQQATAPAATTTSPTVVVSAPVAPSAAPSASSAPIDAPATVQLRRCGRRLREAAQAEAQAEPSSVSIEPCTAPHSGPHAHAHLPRRG